MSELHDKHLQIVFCMGVSPGEGPQDPSIGPVFLQCNPDSQDECPDPFIRGKH